MATRSNGGLQIENSHASSLTSNSGGAVFHKRHKYFRLKASPFGSAVTGGQLSQEHVPYLPVLLILIPSTARVGGGGGGAGGGVRGGGRTVFFFP